jgi:cytochrome c-type biogenesis protein CcmH/NrfG
LVWFGARNQWSAATDPAKYDALFHHACQKIEKGEVDYGIKILRILCKRTPRRLEYRRALWKAQRRAGRSKVWHRAMNAENRRRLRFAQNENDWVAVQAAADDCLEYEPFDGELHLDLGSAFLEQGLREHAIFAFRCAYDLLPDRSEIWETIEELMKS